ncbi:AAA domain containing protein [Nitzschia inconspicua]|uniref:AAA domain containing protein n=1 Tax=Nitzschia inconspicua TaxID=303405 RepID=A0A9K3PWJ0_9STRA|nr:AAA domain containing protein [Nitzschia inconspicua]
MFVRAHKYSLLLTVKEFLNLNDVSFPSIEKKGCCSNEQQTSGTGKSHVIKTSCQYAQKLCKAIGVKFDKRTIVVNALTGAAAVSINGETTAGAFAFKRKVKDELEEFKNTYLVIVDEVSFASVEDMELLNEKMKQIFDNPWDPFGGVPIAFIRRFRSAFTCGWETSVLK